MNRIAFAGNIIVDSVKTVESWPERGMLARILKLTRGVGGSVTNTAIDLKTLDPSVSVSAIGCIGRDEPGEFAMSVMTSRGIDVSRVRRVDAPTSFTDVIRNKGSDPFGGVESGGVAYPFAISRRPFAVILYSSRGECGFASPTCAM